MKEKIAQFLTVAAGQAAFIPSGKKQLIDSGSLTICTFLRFKCLNEGKYIGTLFAHQNNYSSADVLKNIDKALGEYKIERTKPDIIFELESVETAPSTVYEEEGVEGDTLISANEVCTDLKVKEDIGSMQKIAPTSGPMQTQVKLEVEEDGSVKELLNKDDSSCVIS